MKIHKISEGEKLVKIQNDIAAIKEAYHRGQKKSAARRKKYREKNPEKVAQSRKIFLMSNPEYYPEYNKSYRKKNKKKLTDYYNEYMKSPAGEIVKAKRYLKYVEEKVKLDKKRTKWCKPLNMKRIEECMKILGIEKLDFLVG